MVLVVHCSLTQLSEWMHFCFQNSEVSSSEVHKLRHSMLTSRHATRTLESPRLNQSNTPVFSDMLQCLLWKGLWAKVITVDMSSRLLIVQSVFVFFKVFQTVLCPKCRCDFLLVCQLEMCHRCLFRHDGLRWWLSFLCWFIVLTTREGAVTFRKASCVLHLPFLVLLLWIECF